MLDVRSQNSPDQTQSQTKHTTDNDGRNNLVCRRWPREPNGRMLPRPPPDGNRTPNRQMWALTPESFYWIERLPNVAVMSVWSRSMMKEYGENYKEVMEDSKLTEEPPPTRVMSYPLLSRPLIFTKNEEDGDRWARISIQSSPKNRIYSSYPEPEISPPDKYQLPDFGQMFDHKYELEEFLPADFFPEILMVNDPRGLTEAKYPSGNPADYADKLEPSPRKYKLVWPKIYRAAIAEARPIAAFGPCVGHLNLSGSPLLGHGSHSAVYRGALRFASPLLADSPDRSVGVAVKIAYPVKGARDMLHNEAKVYNNIYGSATPTTDNLNNDYPHPKVLSRRHLMEEWTGYNLLPPFMRHPVPVSAVVPKFYGYYVPDVETDERIRRDKREEDMPKCDGENGYWPWSKYSDEGKNASPDTALSPILLMEDCGQPIDVEQLSKDDKSTCMSLLIQMYLHGLMHGSFHTRNILVQPGPLFIHPAKRTMDHPKFRLVDFGRTLIYETHKERRLRDMMGDDHDGRGKTILQIAKQHRSRAESKKSYLEKICKDWDQLFRDELNLAKDEFHIHRFDC